MSPAAGITPALGMDPQGHNLLSGNSRKLSGGNFAAGDGFDQDCRYGRPRNGAKRSVANSCVGRGEFVIPGFAKMSVVNKPATEARSG